MPSPNETPSTHDPDLSSRHDAGPQPEALSPAERALAPEADSPLQSANAIADDGTYVGQSGGYVGASAPAVESGHAQVNADNVSGEGAYGFPAGPEVGIPGGQHHPDVDPPYDPAPVPER